MVVTDNNEPTLYGHGLPQQEVQMVVEQPAGAIPIEDFKDVTGGSLFEWSQLIILPIVLAAFGFATVWLKVRARNRARDASSDPNEIGDETVIQYMKTLMKEDKKK